MAAPTVCLFNKFGYCKFRERCRKQHISEICSSNTCNLFECRKRHPKLCRYFKNYGRCKFSPCAFKHQSQVNDDGIEDIKEKMRFLQNAVDEKNNQIEELSSEISRLKIKLSEIEDKNISVLEVSEKLDTFEEKVEKQFKIMEKMVEYIAKDLNVFGEHVNDLAVELHDDIGNLTEARVDTSALDTSLDQTFKNPFLVVKCDLCTFEAKSERGLKTHKTRKHESCEWCDFVCKEEDDLKKHKLDEHMLKYSAELLRSYM